MFYNDKCIVENIVESSLEMQQKTTAKDNKRYKTTDKKRRDLNDGENEIKTLTKELKQIR